MVHPMTLTWHVLGRYMQPNRSSNHILTGDCVLLVGSPCWTSYKSTPVRFCYAHHSTLGCFRRRTWPQPKQIYEFHRCWLLAQPVQCFIFPLKIISLELCNKYGGDFIMFLAVDPCAGKSCDHFCEEGNCKCFGSYNSNPDGPDGQGECTCPDGTSEVNGEDKGCCSKALQQYCAISYSIDIE